MARAARALRGRPPKRGLGLGGAIRRFREMHGIGQVALAERIGITQGYLSQIEGGRDIAVTEETLGRIAAALGVESWVLLAQAAGLQLDQVERFTEDERVWLDVYRALDSEQRETLLKLAKVMARPVARKRGG
jgi:transcriptional regulator with XRE-family HTH domain